MQEAVKRAIELKQTLVDFVYDAEGEMAVALETYAANHNQKNSYGIKQQNLTIDSFITEGTIGNKTPLDMFLEQSTDLAKSDRAILQRWHDSFVGLFELKKIENNTKTKGKLNRFELMNWLTAKHYLVYAHEQISAKEMDRWKPGEIILTRIAPINNSEWFFFSDRIIKGRLSEPKLAVAIGEFKDNYPHALYADAPELLEQAWESVAQYHQEFVDYFGSDRLTLPGYKLNQKIGELQKIMSQKRLAEAGIDDSKSMSELLQESGTDETEFAETAAELGADTQAITKIINSKNKLAMVIPKVDLPPEIKQAESVTVFSHPRWGQMFLPSYQKFTEILVARDNDNRENSMLLLRKYLEEPQFNYYVWQQLKQDHARALEKLLQIYCDRPNFKIKTDLADLLLEYDKPSQPQLPEIASVPIHLNNLFEAAVAQVQKSKSKTKKKKKKKGFM